MEHLIAAVVVTIVLAAGLAGIGVRAGGRNLAEQWVLGWTFVWWGIALVALIGPVRLAAGIGAAAVVVGAVWWTVHAVRRRECSALLVPGGLLLGAPLWLAPPFFFDALTYHLGLPWSWWVNGSFAPVSDNWFSFFPVAGQSVFLLPVAAGVPEAAAGLHWCTLVAVLVGVYGLARELGADGTPAWIAPLLLVGSWHAVWLAGLAAVDLLVVLGVTVAARAVVRGEGRRDVLVTGAGLGLAAAAKYTAALAVGPLVIAGLVVWQERRRVIASAAAVGAVLACLAPIRNLLLTGNPVFPLLWTWLGGQGWTAADQERFVASGLSSAGFADVGGGLARLLSPAGLGWSFVLAVLLAAIATVSRRSSTVAVRWLGATGAVTVVAWLLLSSRLPRFALPAAAVLAALAAVAVQQVAPRLQRVLLVAAGMVAVLSLMPLYQLVGVDLQLHRLWVGEVSREAWRHGVTVNDPYPAYRACEGLPVGSRLLLVGESRGFGVPVPFHASSACELQRIERWVLEAESPADLARSLRTAGWTHLLVSFGELQRLGPSRGLLRQWPDDVAARWRQFLEHWCRPVVRQGPVEVYELRDVGAISARALGCREIPSGADHVVCDAVAG